MPNATLPTPPFVSGRYPIAGHGPEFLRFPLELLQRGYAERGAVYALKMGLQKMAVLVGPELNELFFRETDRSLNIRRGYPFFSRMFSDRLYFLATPEEYQEQRRFVVPLFKGPQLESYVPIIVEETERLLDRMGEEGELELVKTFGTLVMNVAMHSFLGRAFRERLGDRFFSIFRDFSAGTDPVLPGWLPLPHFIRSRRAKKKLHETLQAVIDERRTMKDPPEDFLQQLITGQYSKGQPIPDLVIIDLILLMSWAGHETTAGHTSWAIVDLLQNPGALERVRQEQVAAFGESDAPSFAELNESPLLEWSLKETERLHPVAFVLMRQATEDLVAGGHRIPKGWLVAITPWVSHRMPELFRDPDRFDPERFSPARGEKMHHLVGFGGGTHRCAGVNFAYLEMKVILSLLLRRYELELIDKDPQPIAGSHTKWPASPCRVRYRRRTSAPVEERSHREPVPA